MPLAGAAKRDYQRDYMRDYMRRRRSAQRQALNANLGISTLPRSEVRKMRRAGLTPEQVRDSGSAFAALLRDRDALRQALVIRKTATVPPVTQSARAQADLASIQRLGDELREKDRHYERLLRLLTQTRELALKQGNTALAARLTLVPRSPDQEVTA